MTRHTSKPTGLLASRWVSLLLGIFMVLTAVVVVQLLITSVPVSRLWQNVFLGLLTPPVAMAAYHAFTRFVERRHPVELEAGPAAREAGLGILIGAALFGALMGLLVLFRSLTIAGTNGSAVLLVPFIGAVTSGIFEEILFRGVLYRILEDGLGSWLALAVSGLIFGGLHLINPHATLMGAIAVMLEAGILLGAAFIMTRRLWLPMGLHFAWNFVQSGIFGLAVSGNSPMPGLLKSSLSGPAWLTGGEFGPEASLLAVVIGLAAGSYMLVRAKRNGNLRSAPWSATRT